MTTLSTAAAGTPSTPGSTQQAPNAVAQQVAVLDQVFATLDENPLAAKNSAGNEEIS
jgi:hypothetical protein